MTIETTTLSHRQIMVIFSGLMMTMFIAFLDQTIVATALPTIASDLGGEAHISWVATAYLLTSTLSAPLYGKLSDLIGRKGLYQTAITVFLLGSMFSGLSQNMTELIAFRALQGLGGGGLMALSFAIIGDVISPRERGKYQGYFSSLTLGGNVVGPLLGGFFAQDLSWRWIFYVNIPIGVAAIIVIAFKLKLPLPHREHVFDLTGSLLMIITVTTLLLALVTGGNSFAWNSVTIIGLLVTSVIAGVLFCWTELHAIEPLFSPKVFVQPIVAVASILTVLFTAAQFVAVIYLPIYLQLAKGVPPVTSGLSMLPFVIATAVSGITSGRLVTKFGRYKVFPIFASVMMSIGIELFSRMDSSTSYLAISLSMIVFGIGMGCGTQVMVTVIQNAVEARDLGIASSALSFFRNIGASFGTAIFGSILIIRLDYWLPYFLPGRHLNAASASSLANPARLGQLAPNVRLGLTQSFVHALHTVFLTALVVELVAIGVALLLREIPLESKSAQSRQISE